jgi:myo-inositol 2-dehydrogenase / D-chiro-inositol 1-dehydrogenase
MKRRNFLKNTAATAAGAMVIPTIVPSSVFGKNAPSNKINIGQIGCGRIARDHDMPGVWKYDIARVMAVSDVDSKRMEDGKQIDRRLLQQKNRK